MNIELLAGVVSEFDAEIDDESVAAALNQTGEPTSRPVSMTEIMRVVYETGLFAKLQAATKNTELSRDAYGEVAALLKLLDVGTVVDMDGETGKRIMATLTEGRFASNEVLAKLRSLAVVPGRSRADVLGLGEVRAEDVRAARRLLDERAAAAEKKAEFDALRERLIAGYLGTLAWLNAEDAAGHDAPSWSDVAGRF